jgi:hypothetical protein
MKNQHISPANTYFLWSDAWVFAALLRSTRDGKQIDLPLLIGAGDLLNHSIFSVDEIANALQKLQKRGIIAVSRKRITYSNEAYSIDQRASKMKGGLFSLVDSFLKIMNSMASGLPVLKETHGFDFITDELIKDAYMQYYKPFVSTERDTE